MKPPSRYVPMNKRIGCLLMLVCSLRDSAAASPETEHTTTHEARSEATTIPLTPLARAYAEVWGLSPTEWQRYESLMSGIRGSVSPTTISPLEVLGIHARDAAERQKYAERWARAMHEDVERILAFQRAYDEANRHLYPTTPLIADTPTPPRVTSSLLTKQDRVLLFVAPACAPCDRAVAAALHAMERVGGLDLYVSQLKSTDLNGIQSWATQHQIPIDAVKRGQITLNFDAGTLTRLGHDQETLPIILRRRGAEVSLISTQSFQ